MNASDSTPPADSTIDIAPFIDHTVLAPETNAAAVEALCADALEYSVAAVCVSPSLVPVAVKAIDGRLGVATVAGFPSGAHPSTAKVADAVFAVEAGATEIDMVVDLGLVVDGRWAEVEADIATVRAAIPHPTQLKVIIEAAALTDEQIVACCERSEAAGADYVKTSTGFHPTGGATVETVELMRATVGDRLGVKASGGIRSREAALALIGAGASRLGTSSTAKILNG